MRGLFIRLACWALGHRWRFRIWKSRTLVPEIAGAIAICGRCLHAADVEIQDLADLERGAGGAN